MGALPDRLPGLPARRERRAAGQVRRRVGRRRPAEARLAPVGDVRRDGARRPDRRLLHRREPGPVRGRPEARHPPARRPRLPRRPGPLPDQDRGARRRGPAGDRGLGRERRDRHQLRAPRPARSQGGRAARRGPRRPGDHLRPGEPDGRRVGRRGRGGRLERGPPALARPRRDVATRGSSPRAASSGRATTRTTRASCSSTRGCGRTRSPAIASRSSRSITTRRSTSSTTTSRSA